jgi:hypothetical protein
VRGDVVTLSDDNQIIQPFQHHRQHIMLHDSDVEADNENLHLPGKGADAALGREDKHESEREKREEEEELVSHCSTEEQERALVTERHDAASTSSAT